MDERRGITWVACPTCGGNWAGFCIVIRRDRDILWLRCAACLDEFQTRERR